MSTLDDFIAPHDDEDDGDISEPADETICQFINRRDAIVEAALTATLDPTLKRLLARTDRPVAIVVRVPASSWAGPVDEALDRRYPHLATGCFTEAKRKSSVEEDAGLLARPRAGTSIATISPDPDELVPGSLRLVAGAVVSVDVPGVAAMKKIIRKVTGTPLVPELSLADYAGLGR